MDGQVPEEVSELEARIVAEIRDSGPISFARFMERALYEPGLGYYASSAARFGREGDFFTAADVSPIFGECLACQLAEMDQLLGEPEPFSVIEFGPGRGWLARDVVDATSAFHPGLSERLRVVLADVSSAMRRECSSRVPEATVCAPEEVGRERSGCVVAVELFDALPVHRLRRVRGRLRELAVGVDRSGVLCELERDPDQAAAVLAERYGAAPEDGDEAEVCPAAAGVLDRLAASLERGFFVIVDYGDHARELYDPARRRGTLLAYHRHRATERYLAQVGEQDLTAHVNFSALTDRAREIDLAVVGFTTQDRFLIANGVLERFEEQDPDRWNDPRRVQSRLQALQLVHPEGMGRVFKVLLLAKGLEPLPRLAGLADPFAREA